MSGELEQPEQSALVKQVSFCREGTHYLAQVFVTGGANSLENQRIGMVPIELEPGQEPVAQTAIPSKDYAVTPETYFCGLIIPFDTYRSAFKAFQEAGFQIDPCSPLPPKPTWEPQPRVITLEMAGAAVQTELGRAVDAAVDTAFEPHYR